MTSNLVNDLEHIGLGKIGEKTAIRKIATDALMEIEQLQTALASALAKQGELRHLLSRADTAMHCYFSNEFDGGRQFSELTGDIPKALEGLPVETNEVRPVDGVTRLLMEARPYVESFIELTKFDTAARDARDLVRRIREELGFAPKTGAAP